MAEGFRQSGALDSGWVNGEAFCAGCGFHKWESDYKYLNQYIVDNNIFENMGGIDKSPVVAFMEEYIWPYEDRSREGILAAHLGMPKEWVVNTLAFADDLRNSPREVHELIASAPNIYASYYRGQSNELYIPETENSCRILAQMQKCTQIAGTELRRRFNAEAVA
jgi:hypothetical protein